jgi:hypothetical protein
VWSEGDPTRCAPLSLQLFLEFIEEALVGALGDDFLWDCLDHAHFMQAQGIEPHRILRREVAPLEVGELLERLHRVIVARGEPPVDQKPGGAAKWPMRRPLTADTGSAPR